MSQRLVIQNKLCDVIDASKFYEVTYTPGTGRPIAYNPDTAPSIEPDSVRTNEIAERFGPDTDYGQSLILKPVAWTFVLYLDWNNKEIDLSAFEKGLMMNPPHIDAQGNDRSVDLYVLSKEVSHPVQQDASTGTQAKFLFQAELGRA